MPEVRPVAEAVIVIEPATEPVTAFDATPEAAVAAPRPVTVPTPAVFANVTEVELSLVRTLFAASRTSAVSVRAEPEARLAVELVKVRWSAAPGSIVKVVVPEVSPPAEAVTVIEPASTAVTGSEATPDEAVAAPRPVTVPAPAVFANVTTVELSIVRRLSLASLTSAVSVRAAPEVRLAVELVTTTLFAAPYTFTVVVNVTVLSTLSLPVSTYW